MLKKKYSQVAILKLKHYGFLHLIAYLYLYNSLLFIFQISNSLSKKMKNFEWYKIRDQCILTIKLYIYIDNIIHIVFIILIVILSKRNEN